MIQRNLIPRNPLMRRLQGHAQFATLFRAEDSNLRFEYAQPLVVINTPSTTVAPETSKMDAPPMVQPVHSPLSVASSGQMPTTNTSASIQSPVAVFAQAAPPLSGPRGEPPSIIQTQAADLRTSTQAKTDSPSQSPSATDVSITEPPPSAERPINLDATETTAVSAEDRNWKRLQAIMQKHEEKAGVILADTSAPQAAPTNPATTAQVQRRSAPASIPPQVNPSVPAALSEAAPRRPTLVTNLPGNMPGNTPEVHQPQSTGVTEAAKTSSSAQSLPNSPVQPPTVQPSKPPVLPGERRTNTQLPIAAELLPANSRSVTTTVMASEIEQSQALDRMIATGETKDPVRTATTGIETESRPATAVDKAQPAIIPHRLADKLPEDPGSETAMQQTMPLQAVWPVQRRQASLDMPAGPQLQTGTTWPTLLAPLPDATVQTALQPIPTAQPTNSAIEVLAPRRPRPIVQHAPQSDAPTAAHLQGQMLITQSPDTGTTLARASGNQLSTPIATEIGTLPSDLWSLIGQAAPVAPPISPLPPAISLLPASIEPPIDPIQYQSEQLSAPVIQSLPAASTTAPVDKPTSFPGETQQASRDAGLQATNVSKDIATPPQTARLAPASISGQDWAANNSVQPPRQPAGDGSIRSSTPTAPEPVPFEGMSSSAVQLNDLKSQRAITLAETAAQTQPAIAEHTNVSETPLSIQRQPAETVYRAENPPAAASPPAAHSPPIGEPPGQADASAIDMDELVRQVYANLKRRLLIEWERLLRH